MIGDPGYAEARISINGVELPLNESMALRMAITSMRGHLEDKNYMGDDDVGRTHTTLWHRNLSRVLQKTLDDIGEQQGRDYGRVSGCT